ncbi:MAG: electron transfer flavoprotein subunit alpha/FixB family protein [Chloroflexi bacterium]|nr:electron transfer flavoprotein subunit alpha/FixB family protein [Chloroflexota bacterium]
MAGVLLIAEVSGEQLAATTAELVAEGGRLAKELGGGPVTVLLAGKNVQGLASSLGQLGAEKVQVADSQGPTPPSPLWLLAAAEQAAKQVGPDVILLTHAGGARDLGPSLAYRLGSGIVTDATALRVDSGELVITKPVFGGSAIAEFSIASTPQVVTLRPRAFESAEPPTAREANVEALAVSDAEGSVEVLEEIREQATTGPRLKDAKVIVSGGRGLGGPENWHVVDELAQLLGGAVGATRAVTDAGWVAPSLQVNRSCPPSSSASRSCAAETIPVCGDRHLAAVGRRGLQRGSGPWPGSDPDAHRAWRAARRRESGHPAGGPLYAAHGRWPGAELRRRVRLQRWRGARHDAGPHAPAHGVGRPRECHLPHGQWHARRPERHRRK